MNRCQLMLAHKLTISYSLQSRGDYLEALALAFASTIRHDGQGGVADDLEDVVGLQAWLTANTSLLATFGVKDVQPADVTAELHADLLQLRRAVRALFANAVRPRPPSRADTARLLSLPEAAHLINQASANQPTWSQLAVDAEHNLHAHTQTLPINIGIDVSGAIARATISLLTGPQAGHIRACQAPRCVRYFIKQHPRQECCKPACANRARVARHYRKHRPNGLSDA